MTPLIVVLGIVGALLILAGLVGGDFTLSGKFMPQVGMPKIGNWVRLPCFSVGAVLVVVAIGLGVVYSPIQSSASDGSSSGSTASAAPADTTSPTSASPSPTDTSNQIATGTVMAPQGDTTLYVFEQPSLSSQHVAEIADGTTIGILCTAQGDVVTNPDNGESSSPWDSTSEGFVPDVSIHGVLGAARRRAPVVELLVQVEHAFGSCTMRLVRLASRVTWSRGCGL